MMMEQWAHRPGAVSEAAARGRRTLDRAEGVLIGLRGCSSEDAFMELVTAARDTGHRLSSITFALLDVASHRDDASSAHDVVRARWGLLLDSRLAVGGAVDTPAPEHN